MNVDEFLALPLPAASSSHSLTQSTSGITLADAIASRGTRGIGLAEIEYGGDTYCISSIDSLDRAVLWRDGSDHPTFADPHLCRVVSWPPLPVRDLSASTVTSSPEVEESAREAASLRRKAQRLARQRSGW